MKLFRESKQVIKLRKVDPRATGASNPDKLISYRADGTILAVVDVTSDSQDFESVDN